MLTPSLALTGGAGFIGSHLCRRLLASGAALSVLDDFSAPSPLGLPRSEQLQVHVGDVRASAVVAAALDGAPVVLHLASVVGVDAVTADPARTGSVIRDGTARVLQHCRRTGARLVFFSSSEVTDPPRDGPRAEYAGAKRDAEALLLAAARDVPLTILRPFNIVGRGQAAPGMVLPALARAARAGRPLPLHGDGRQERSFLHVDDLVDVILALLAAPMGPSGEILEVGSEARASIAEVAERVCALAGVAARVATVDPGPRREDRPRRGPDLAPLRRRVAFAPRRDLDSILREALLHA